MTVVPRTVLLLTLGALVIGSGCAARNRHRYHDVIAPLQVAGAGRVAVGVHDRRPYVLSGRKRPDFVGLQRGGYGNPFNVATVSGESLAHDMGDSIVRSLAARGFQATAVELSPHDDPSSIVTRLAATQAERAVLLVIREWKADSMVNTALHYDVSLHILDREGRVLAEKNAIGKDKLGGSFWNPPVHARAAVPAAFGQKLGELMNDSAVAAALSSVR